MDKVNRALICKRIRSRSKAEILAMGQEIGFNENEMAVFVNLCTKNKTREMLAFERSCCNREITKTTNIVIAKTFNYLTFIDNGRQINGKEMTFQRWQEIQSQINHF